MRITGGRKKIRIGDLLVEAGAITEEELQEALAYQKENGGRIGNVIMELGFISQELLITVLTTQMGIDYIELGKRTGQMAAKLIKGESTASEMPYETITDYKVYINTKACNSLSVEIPSDISETAIEASEAE